ncbi:unnamed protein product [Didymodactylos carnosus]|uniref:Pre-mRNA-splicing factor 18 n=1 Tax=Didymodactylos carnosus TaxID=1234261 RepID=A0A813WMP3_9BILA|nr:unnamed protein product [Didymodactylos carnosus]CAF1019204.1 unnamed protein product [Didymodactylos carnosus]CAF3644880.1 unnamed protein product [Didymodactylos carnosus]CAF3787917.1 unnamed protein product [Didymodactylos carnosus]
MDLSFLKAEIEKKRKNVESLNILLPEKRCFRRSDLEAKNEEIYWKNYYSKNNVDSVKTSSTSSTTSSSTNEVSSSMNSHSLNTEEPASTEKQLPPRSDIIKKFRERNQPIRLFGESDIDSYKRLRLLETMEPELKGQRNDFKAAMDKIDREYLSLILHANHPTSSSSDTTVDDKSLEANGTPTVITVEVKDEGFDLPDIIEQIKTTRKGNRAYDCQVILNYFKFLLKKWAQELNARDIDEKKTIQGKIETALHTQTLGYMKPLFRKLKSNTLQDDILEALINIVNCVLRRNYIRANEYFLEMAIGNAPWPLGATMVGIHPRPGREKIASKYVAHVLNDETQRKYIQAVKRLISKAQKLYPTIPSQCVDYGLKKENVTIVPSGKN